MRKALYLSEQLELDRCPHCAVAHPNLSRLNNWRTSAALGYEHEWSVYMCHTCGALVTASAARLNGSVDAIFPQPKGEPQEIPMPARRSLTQCRETFHAPEASIMLAAKAIDEMLKAVGRTDGSLYSRLRQAAEEHLITREMEIWAHNIRLDANDQRHADTVAGIPTSADAERCYRFAMALGEYLFVLPAMVTKGVRDSEGKTNRVNPPEAGSESPA
ncbi:MAG: DUF4145 domain-containing protein [Acidobacteria bacterium]|nr:DUF4145 domain-containing protein [Acidobacteriota bacterium]